MSRACIPLLPPQSRITTNEPSVRNTPDSRDRNRSVVPRCHRQRTCNRPSCPVGFDSDGLARYQLPGHLSMRQANRKMESNGPCDRGGFRSGPSLTVAYRLPGVKVGSTRRRVGINHGQHRMPGFWKPARLSPLLVEWPHYIKPQKWPSGTQRISRLSGSRAAALILAAGYLAWRRWFRTPRK
jgi:hypothetical protein